MNIMNVRQKPQIYFVIGIILLIVILGAKRMMDSRTNASTTTVTTVSGENVKETPLNKKYVFSMKDNAGKEIGKINYAIESAYPSQEIVNKGKRIQAVNGKSFVILNLKLKNDLPQSLKVNSADYIRLSVNRNTNEWYAPDIHTDPADLQPISTKAVRLAFTINSSDKDLVLQVGEVNGSKEVIKLALN